MENKKIYMGGALVQEPEFQDKKGVIIMEDNNGGENYELEVKCSKCELVKNIVLRVKNERLDWFIANKNEYICEICFFKK